ncbi:MAG: hypothetical protein M3R64_03355 [Pseudomonadota bacterium]|nr:hypothetical protein [Pseudomonadota bacterium]
MTHLIKKAGLALAMGATALTVAAPADAQRYRDYRHHDNTGTAIIAGIAGLAIGAVIASSSNNQNRYRQRGYTQGGDYRDGYGYNDGRYNDGRYGNEYRRSYGQTYGQTYGQNYGQNYGQTYGGYGSYNGQSAYGGCHIENRYDRYSRRSVAVRVCS